MQPFRSEFFAARMGTRCCCARDREGNLQEAPRITFLELHRAQKMHYFDLPSARSLQDSSLKPDVESEVLSKNGSSRGKDSTSDVQMLFFLPAQTIIFFDWDDTLFPSNWWRSTLLPRSLSGSFLQLPPLSDHEIASFASLEDSLRQLIELATALARVVIVTNSCEPWVSLSVKHFMPSLEPILEKADVKVVYARSVSGGGTGSTDECNTKTSMTDLAAQVESQDPQKWKEAAFNDELSTFYGKRSWNEQGTTRDWKNVLSIGDQDCERDAAQTVVRNSRHSKACRVKTVKLIENPDIDDLVVEQRIVCDALRLLVNADGNLDVEVDRQDLNHGRSLVG